jgi:hypothetical protein
MPAAITSNQSWVPAQAVSSSTVTFSGVVVVAIARRSPAARASASRRLTPGRMGMPPRAASAA